MFVIQDNYDVFRDYSDREEESIENLPVCDCCGEHIQDEYYYDLSDLGGGFFCEECVREHFRRSVD